MFMPTFILPSSKNNTLSFFLSGSLASISILRIGATTTVSPKTMPAVVTYNQNPHSSATPSFSFFTNSGLFIFKAVSAITPGIGTQVASSRSQSSCHTAELASLQEEISPSLFSDLPSNMSPLAFNSYFLPTYNPPPSPHSPFSFRYETKYSGVRRICSTLPPTLRQVTGLKAYL